MSPLTILGKNTALDGLRVAATHMGLFSKGADITAVTGVTATDIFTKTAHGLASGDLVTFAAQTGATGIIAGDPYFVSATNLAANTFSVALTPGGAIVDLVTDLTTATVNKWTEISGGAPAYARKAIAWAVAALGVLDDSTNGLPFDVPAGANVDAQALFSAVTAGNLLELAPVTRESFGAQGVYTSTDAKVNAIS